MSLRRFLPVLILSSLTIPIGAQAVIRDIRFTPPTFFVGDRVILRLDFDISGSIVLDVPSVLPENDWLEIHRVDVNQTADKASVIIEFTSFAPGTRTLPSMEIGSLRLTDVKIPTHSILPSTHDGVRMLRGQLILPGTRLGVALILTLAAMTPFLGYILAATLWKSVRTFRERYRFGRPVRRFRRLLKRLRTGIGTVVAPLWFAELTDGLRTYLTSRTGFDCRSATTAEIGRLEGFPGDVGPRACLLAVLQDGDLVKFAGRFADDRKMQKTLQDVERAVGEWERANAEL